MAGLYKHIIFYVIKQGNHLYNIKIELLYARFNSWLTTARNVGLLIITIIEYQPNRELGINR